MTNEYSELFEKVEKKFVKEHDLVNALFDRINKTSKHDFVVALATELALIHPTTQSSFWESIVEIASIYSSESKLNDKRNARGRGIAEKVAKL